MINNNGSLSKRIMMSGENGIYWLSLWKHLGIKRRGEIRNDDDDGCKVLLTTNNGNR